MTDKSQSSGRSQESEFRSKGAPRLPRIPEPVQSRQTMFTAVAIWLIFIVVIAWVIVG